MDFSFSSPDKASPGGCILGLFALGLIAYGMVSAWVSYLVVTSADAQQHKDSVLRFYGPAAVFSLGLGIWLLRVGWRMAWAADMSEPDNPNKPTMRF